ncbi:exodeoxyribonuclease V subunit gamma [Chromohalobacter sp. HP20-39]|uniref:exodeoxyribonuclease V subunit gamma n=1 Tax=Chromohalobacter sp. HP20-39 TaxID=3079306 RepID=UPI00294B507A|nr:exodeoxyribonuclease V subunit gamma [Chromohalobacter sp. HP20-39]MDV6319550.1 exodeoxyribonuclease V subunit gamma [Chromohalobacter sp. HP20-39]
MFSVIHANHLEDLGTLALDVIRRHRQPPLVPETFLVQSNGMAQWLRLTLAEADGIAASVDFPLPSSFVWRAYRAVLGDDIPEQSPFDKTPLAWRLMHLLERCLDPQAAPDDPSCYAPLRDYLQSEALEASPMPGAAHEARERRRWHLAVRLADLFDQYLIYRPEWIEAWERGETAPLELPDDQRWQPALWRALIEDAPAQAREHHRARLHRRFLDAARQLRERPRDMPPRLFVFGISALPAQTLEALHALSGVVDVFLMIANPCRHYWGDIVSDRDAIKRAGRLSAQARHEQETRHPEAPWLAELDEEALHLHANPLLAGWGTQGRDFIVGLYEFESARGFDLETDVFRDMAPAQSPTLLQQLQQDVLELAHPGERARQEGAPRTIAADDDSLALVSAHSPLREVEILHDRLLAAFEDAEAAGEPLRPRDIVVMVPEIDRYAPCIEAVFGQLPPSHPRHIPFTIADQVASEAHPLMVLALLLLDLPERRLTVSEVLDALEVPAFRARFAIDEAELERLRQWLAGSGVRWGLSAEHRHSLGFPALGENSWRFGLSRMLLGYAVGEPASTGAQGESDDSLGRPPRWDFQGIVPYAEVGGLEADLAGRVAALLDTLETQCAALSERLSPEAWLGRLQALFSACVSPTTAEEHDVVARLDAALGRWSQQCRQAGFEAPVGLGVVRDALRAELDEGGLAQRFLAGKVNFATLMPMRAIPFRHVYLLGMNDGDYPRVRQPQDFDLMATRPRPGDRSRRDDDRYLMLEAMLSARERLTLSWVGRDVRDNTPRPPSVLLGELLDTLEQGWDVPESDAADRATRLAQRLIETHPLQPFSRRYFERDDPRFTYESSWEALYRPPERDESVLPHAATAVELPSEPLGLGDLQRVLRRPWTVYLGRLGVHFADAHVPDEDNEPFAPDGLEDHGLKRELLEGARDGVPLTAVAERLRMAGRLPTAGFGEALIEPRLARLSRQVESWRREVAECVASTPPLVRYVAVHEALDDKALTLEARLDGLFAAPEEALAPWRLVTLEPGHYGHLKVEGEGPYRHVGKLHRLYAGYLRWLLANATLEASCAWTAIFEDRCLSLPGLDKASAAGELDGLLAAWARAYRAPWPAIDEIAKEVWKRLPRADWVPLAAGEAPDAGVREALIARYETDAFAGPAALRASDGALGQLWPDFATFEAAGGIAASLIQYAPLMDMLARITQRVHGGRS